MIAIVRNRTTGSTQTFNNVERIESNLLFIRKSLAYTKLKQGESNGQEQHLERPS